MPMEVTATGNEVSAVLRGEMFADDAAKFHAEMLKYSDSGIAVFKIDLAELTYIDSAGLGALVAVYKKAAELGGSVQLSGLKGDIKQLFELTSLNKVFNIRD